MTTDEPGFEESLKRLDRAVAALEGGELGLDEALARYEEGVHWLGRCKALLDAAERQVALLTGVEADGRPQTAPFHSTPTGGGE